MRNEPTTFLDDLSLAFTADKFIEHDWITAQTLLSCTPREDEFPQMNFSILPEAFRGACGSCAHPLGSRKMWAAVMLRRARTSSLAPAKPIYRSSSRKHPKPKFCVSCSLLVLPGERTQQWGHSRCEMLVSRTGADTARTNCSRRETAEVSLSSHGSHNLTSEGNELFTEDSCT